MISITFSQVFVALGAILALKIVVMYRTMLENSKVSRAQLSSLPSDPRADLRFSTPLGPGRSLNFLPLSLTSPSSPPQHPLPQPRRCSGLDSQVREVQQAGIELHRQDQLLLRQTPYPLRRQCGCSQAGQHQPEVVVQAHGYVQSVGLLWSESG